MKPTILKLSLTAGLLLGSATAALAQQPQGQVDPAAQAQYDQQLQRYQSQQTQYQYEQQRYQDRKDAYADRRDAYEARRDRWAATRDQYLRDRADYDAHWGPGAWDRVYIYDDGYVLRRVGP